MTSTSGSGGSPGQAEARAQTPSQSATATTPGLRLGCRPGVLPTRPGGWARRPGQQAQVQVGQLADSRENGSQDGHEHHPRMGGLHRPLTGPVRSAARLRPQRPVRVRQLRVWETPGASDACSGAVGSHWYLDPSSLIRALVGGSSLWSRPAQVVACAVHAQRVASRV